jgi:hypothetical protein
MEQGGIIEMTTATVIVVDLGAELTHPSPQFSSLIPSPSVIPTAADGLGCVTGIHYLSICCILEIGSYFILGPTWN